MENVKMLSNLSIRLSRVENKVDILEERTRLLPSLYNKVDKLIGEIIENRQEREFISHRVGRLENKVNKITK